MPCAFLPPLGALDVWMASTEIEETRLPQAAEPGSAAAIRPRLVGGARGDLTRRRKDGLMDDPPFRVVGDEADAEAERLHAEVAEFVRWFTSWWLTRGLELVAEEEVEERRAA
jgi:hypothetical protein